MRSHLHRPGLDWLTGFLIPLCIVGMIGSVVYFLIALRTTFVSGGESVLRYVAFWFLLASVGIGVIRRQYGSSVVAGPYLIALGVVMAIFLFVFSAAFGTIAGEEGGSLPLQLLLNYLLVGLIWWAANAITADCTLEAADVEDPPPTPPAQAAEPEAPEEDGETSAEDTRAPAEDAAAATAVAVPGAPTTTALPVTPAPATKRRRVGRSVLLFSVPVLLVFAIGQRVLAGAGRERDGHALACMIVYLICAMTLLALTSLSGLRLYLRLRRVAMPRGAVSLWLGLSAVCIALVLLLAGALPRGYGGRRAGHERSVRVVGTLARSWEWMERLPFRGDSRPTGAPDSGEKGHRHVRDERPRVVLTEDPNAPGVLGERGPAVSAEGGSRPGGRAAGAGAGQGQSGEQTARGVPHPQGNTPVPGNGSRGEQPGAAPTSHDGGPPLPAENAPQGEAGTAADAHQRAQQGETPGSETGAGPEPTAAAPQTPRPAGTSPQTAEPPQPAEAPPGESVIGESADAAAADLDRDEPRAPWSPPDARTLVPFLLAVLAALAAYGLWRSGLLRWLAERLRRLRLPRNAWKRESAPAEERPRDPFADPDLSPVEQVERAYAGLLAYAEALGCPRHPQETPIEYGKRMPSALQVVRRDAIRLTRLYVMATYGGQEIGETHLAEARDSWERIRRLLDARLAQAE